MQGVLVLENNEQSADRLVSALEQVEDLSVSVVPTLREACFIVAQVSQALAFIPHAEGARLGLSLRSLQPDLKLILTTADSQLLLSNRCRKDYQGLLHISKLEEELPAILGLIGLETGPFPLIQQPTLEKLPDSGEFQRACQEIEFGEGAAVQLAVLSMTDKLIACSGPGHDSQAYAVTELVAQSWPEKKISAQIQFLQLPEYYDASLIYSRQIAGAILSLVAEPETPVDELRRTADDLICNLANLDPANATSVQATIPMVGRNKELAPPARQMTSYVIAWRPIKPVPAFFQGIIRNSIAEIAEQHECKLDYLAVTTNLVHLVIACPAGKTAAWAGFVLKSGIDEDLKRQFGAKLSIWRKGFFAVESSQPLKEAELSMLLKP